MVLSHLDIPYRMWVLSKDPSNFLYLMLLSHVMVPYRHPPTTGPPFLFYKKEL